MWRYGRFELRRVALRARHLRSFLDPGVTPHSLVVVSSCKGTNASAFRRIINAAVQIEAVVFVRRATATAAAYQCLGDGALLVRQVVVLGIIVGVTSGSWLHRKKVNNGTAVTKGSVPTFEASYHVVFELAFLVNYQTKSEAIKISRLVRLRQCEEANDLPTPASTCAMLATKKSAARANTAIFVIVLCCVLRFAAM